MHFPTSTVDNFKAAMNLMDDFADSVDVVRSNSPQLLGKTAFAV